jgi:hypothetical protein
VVGQYDKRADVENLVEAKREGLEAIPSAKFKQLCVLQLVMLSYNIRRYIKLLAAASQGRKEMPSLKTLASNTIRIARLKLPLPPKLSKIKTEIRSSTHTR